MTGTKRRDRIIQILDQEKKAISASRLAEQFHVSRQIIVGDIALLRASGQNILSTPRGYMMEQTTQQFIHRIACQHTSKDMKKELYLIVDLGCTVIDVIVEHPIYGELIGSLQLSCRYDVDQYIARCEKYDAQPLSLLTEGVHLHTISCPDETVYQTLLDQLKKENILICD